MRQAVLRMGRTLSPAGLVAGTLFFAVSLTPSLLPRGYALQGVLSGCCFSAGYLAGVLATALWRYLELPDLPLRAARWTLYVSGALCALVAAAFLWRASGWQNSIRDLMGLPPVETARPLEVGGLALAVFAALLLLARLIGLSMRWSSGRLERRLPRRLSNVIGGALVLWLVWAAVDGVLFRQAMRMADTAFRNLDALVEPDVARPEDPLRSGSPQSLLDWGGLGRAGRAFVTAGPRAAEIEDFTGRPALDPIRVYVGLNSAETVAERARLAVAELQRVGAFGRKVLVVITPTGTGWIDPEAIDPLEYLHDGDVASVALQYSYLTSWLSLLVEPDYGAEAASALFSEVYRVWTALPRDARPRLYLYGLSLGALQSDAALDPFDVLGDPPQGALWAGPPFSSPTWLAAVRGREPGSPAWLPRVRDGSVIRFYDQRGRAPGPVAPWGAMRIAYLQYASDPVVFFDPTLAWREPDWMYAPRGPDVSPALRWFPVVTQLQLALDMALATTAPLGHGHLYAAEHYIPVWVEVTEPEGWTAADVERLRRLFRDRRGG